MRRWLATLGWRFRFLFRLAERILRDVDPFDADIALQLEYLAFLKIHILCMCISAYVREREPVVRAISSVSTGTQPFSDPHFDDGLSGNAEPLGFFVERLNHPHGEINIDPLQLPSGAGCLGKIQVL